MKKRRINNKMGLQIMLILLFTIILPSALFFLFIVNRYSQDLLDQAIAERENLLQEINRRVELQLTDFRELSMTIYYDATTKSFIDSGKYDAPPDSVNESMQAILDAKPYVDALVLCFGDHVYSYGRNFSSLKSYREKYEASVLALGGRSIWLPTEQMQGSFSRKPRDFALGRAINTATETVGAFYMFCSSDFFSRVMTNDILTAGDSHYYVVGMGNQIVSSDRDETIGTRANLTFDIERCAGERGYFTSQGEAGQEQVVAYARMRDTDWISIIVSNGDYIYGNARALMKMAITFSLFYLLVMIAGYSGIYIFIIRPLGKLSNGMAHVSRGEFLELRRPAGHNEIGQLTESYNDMVVHIQTLITEVREKESEKNRQRMKVLYMQIGPHFLYNTLNSIKWMAVLNNQSNIKLMTEALMKLTSGVAHNKEDFVTLRQELELLESYVYIQKVRFTNFSVSRDIPEELLRLKIGRFMLQPFVENSIIHGIRGLPCEGEIHICARRENGALKIEITDNGRGFDAAAKAPEASGGGESDHIGIKNVEERIRLHCGADYGVRVESAAGKGTTVLLTLPVITGEDIP